MLDILERVADIRNEYTNASSAEKHESHPTVDCISRLSNRLDIVSNLLSSFSWLDLGIGKGQLPTSRALNSGRPSTKKWKRDNVCFGSDSTTTSCYHLSLRDIGTSYLRKWLGRWAVMSSYAHVNAVHIECHFWRTMRGCHWIRERLVVWQSLIVNMCYGYLLAISGTIQLSWPSTRPVGSTNPSQSGSWL